MYHIPSLYLAIALFIFILINYELGYRWGRKLQRESNTEIKNQTQSIQAGVLGLLALLLGFTFNMAVQRYESRNDSLIREVNAIGTAQLRLSLLPDSLQFDLPQLMDEYIQHRIQFASIHLDEGEQRLQAEREINSIQNQLWASAQQAALIDPRPVVTGYFIQALNEVFDARTARIASQNRHVPEVILFLLFLIFALSMALIGYSGGLSGRRAYVPTALLNLLIVLVVFIIIDLDRPKRGLIQIPTENLSALMPVKATE